MYYNMVEHNYYNDVFSQEVDRFGIAYPIPECNSCKCFSAFFMIKNARSSCCSKVK